MEDSKKKKVMLIIIAVCLSVAAAMFFFTRSQIAKIPSFEGETVTLKCSNPDCQATHEMDKHEYYKFVQENRHPLSLSAPPMVCKECGEKSVIKAFKCEECDIVFLPYAAQSDLPDICPECDFRVTEK